LGERDPGKGPNHLPTHPQALTRMTVAKEVDEGGQGVVGDVLGRRERLVKLTRRSIEHQDRRPSKLHSLNIKQ